MALLSHLPASSVSAHQQYQHGLYMPGINLNDEKRINEPAVLEDQAKVQALTDLTNSKIVTVSMIMWSQLYNRTNQVCGGSVYCFYINIVVS